MTTYKFPPAHKTLYGLTTGTVYEPQEDSFALWRAGGRPLDIFEIGEAEPDGVTDVPPFKVGNTVSSIEDLDALPNDTILRDESGAWEKGMGWFFSAGRKVGFTSSELADGNTLTILWLPGTRNADS